MSAKADDPTDIIRARGSVVGAESSFERPRDSIGQRPQLADCTSSTDIPRSRRGNAQCQFSESFRERMLAAKSCQCQSEKAVTQRPRQAVPKCVLFDKAPIASFCRWHDSEPVADIRGSFCHPVYKATKEDLQLHAAG